MDEDTYQLDWEITEAMLRYGGSFVKGLGNLWRLGDMMNRQRLKDTFDDYWKNYTKIVRQRRLDESPRRWYE